MQAFQKTINFTTFTLNSELNYSFLYNWYINLDTLTTLNSFNFFSTTSFFNSIFYLKLLNLMSIERKKKTIKWKKIMKIIEKWKLAKEDKRKKLYEIHYEFKRIKWFSFFFSTFSLRKKYYFNSWFKLYNRYQKIFYQTKQFPNLVHRWIFLDFFFPWYNNYFFVTKSYYCEYIHLFFEFGYKEYEWSSETLIKHTISEMKLTALTDFLQEMHWKKLNPGNIWNSPSFTDLDEYFLYYKWGLEFELFKFSKHLVSHRYFGTPEKLINKNLVKEKFFFLNKLKIKDLSNSNSLKNSTFKYPDIFSIKLMSNNNKMLELFWLHFSLTVSSIRESYRIQWLQIGYFSNLTNLKFFWKKNTFFNFMRSAMHRFMVW